jgi:hypothetical protein
VYREQDHRASRRRGPHTQAHWTGQKYFVYRVVEAMLGVKYGSTEAHSHEYTRDGRGRATHLTVYDQQGEVVLRGKVDELKRELARITAEKAREAIKRRKQLYE